MKKKRRKANFEYMYIYSNIYEFMLLSSWERLLFLVLLISILIPEVIISTLDSRRVDSSSELKKRLSGKKETYTHYI